MNNHQLSERVLEHIQRKISDIPYCDQSPSQILDIWYPNEESAIPYPVIIHFHGGGFRHGGHREDSSEPMLRGIDRGYAVVSVEYRKSDEATFPAMLYDAKASIRFLKANADKYHLDPERIALWGPSAGGWLVSMTALTVGNPAYEDLEMGNPDIDANVQAVIDWCGPCGGFLMMDEDYQGSGVKPVEQHNDAESAESLFMGRKILEIPELVKMASPYLHVNIEMPPFLIMHGNADAVVPVEQSLRFAGAIKRVAGKDKVELHVFDNVPHHGRVWWHEDEVADRCFDYLDDKLKNKGVEVMSSNMFAIVGNWGFVPAPKGISTFRYDAGSGALDLVETIRPDIAAGQLCVDEERHIVYTVNECGERRDEIGGGGYVLAFQINPETGELILINEQESLSPEPSYLCLSKNKKYLIACHCADPFHVTKIIKHKDGSYRNEVLFDDTALVLFPLLEDGSIGKPCDVFVTMGSGGKEPNSQKNVDPVTRHIQLVRVISRLHAVVASPDRDLFVTCDKGMDKLITFRVDEENGRFVILNEYQTEEVACFPRYGAFHPTLPVFYANNENLALLNSFHYDKNGKLELFDKLALLVEDAGLIDGKPVGAQDILVHPNGRTLYVTLCGLNDIVVVSLDEAGRPTLKQQINSDGILPRGICLSPDEQFLLSGNMVSGDITTFQVLDDGTLKYSGNKYGAVSPSAIRFLMTPE